MANQLLVTQIGRPRSISWELLAAALTLALIFHSPASCQEIPDDELPRREFNDLTYKQVTREIFQGERDIIKQLGMASLVTEAYVQSLAHAERDGMDADLSERGEGVIDDAYFLGSVSLKDPYDKGPVEQLLFGKQWSDQYIRISRNLSDRLFPIGQLMMFFVDLTDFDADTYTLTYEGPERLLDTECMLFSVVPNDPHPSGRFSGKIWVESSSRKIVRIKGVFLGPNGKWQNLFGTRLYFHFDSWREKVHDGVWVPTSTYYEERRTFHADGNLQFHYRGYSLLWQGESKGHPAPLNVNLHNSVDVTASSRRSNGDPLARLEDDGLLAVPGEVERKLDGIVREITTGAGLHQVVHCRILLTTPAETMAIGNSIIISRGLLNLVPDDSVLAVLLARQIAHIVLDDPDPFTLRWPESLFAFSKKQDFPGLGIRHTPKQEESADQEALLLIKGSRYEHAVPETKVFLSQLSAESRRFRNLVRPRFGIAVTPRGCGLVDHHVRKTPATSTGFQLRDTYGVSWAGAVIEHESARVQAGSGNGQQNLPRTAASAR